MVDLFVKTKDKDLYACPEPKCPVSTFIDWTFCPHCKHPGLLIRYKLDSRGAPTRMAEGAGAGT